jgi:hypothetical protein
VRIRLQRPLGISPFIIVARGVVLASVPFVFTPQRRRDFFIRETVFSTRQNATPALQTGSVLNAWRTWRACRFPIMVRVTMGILGLPQSWLVGLASSRRTPNTGLAIRIAKCERILLPMVLAK